MPINQPFPSSCGSIKNEAHVSYGERAIDLQREGFVQWTNSENRFFTPVTKTTPKLHPGVYEIRQSQTGIYFEKIQIDAEKLVQFKDSNSDIVVKEIQHFWEREHLFKEYGLSYKRGILLYGPPGSGKSCTIQQVMEDVVTRGGIVLKFFNPNLFSEGLKILRTIESDTPVVAIMEDVESIIHTFCESEVLNIIDGINDCHKVVFLATTNHPELLGERIKNRPSRFDKRFFIDTPDAETRRIYFTEVIGVKRIEEMKLNIDQWVEDTEGMSIAHLKELFVAVVFLDNPYDEALQTLTEMGEKIDQKKYEGFGFSSSSSKSRRSTINKV